jgi:protoporphyrinogen oxidase
VNRRAGWAIVGGGMLGMTLAHRLAQAGQRVALFEAAPSLGGLASAWTLGDVVWDKHYHVTLLSDSVLRSLLNELGLEHEIDWVTTKTGVYADRALYSVSDLAEFMRFPLLGLIDKLRLGATILHAARLRDWQPLEEIPVSQWLVRLGGQRTFEKLWLPLLRAKLGENYRQTSAAFIWAVIARLYAARRTGLKKEMFGYVPGGYARVLGRFEHRLRQEGVRVETAHPVQSIVAHPGSGLEVTFASGAVERFENVAVTVPAPVASVVCPQLSKDELTRLRGVHYQGIICASLLLRRPLGPYYVTNITDPQIPFTAVVEMSALVDRRHFGGHALVYLPKYLPAEDAGFMLPDEQIETAFLHGLERMYPAFSRDDVIKFRISRARYVLPIPTVGYSRRLPPMVTSVPGLFTVSSAHIVNGTLNVNETVTLADRAAMQLLSVADDRLRTRAKV